jgi:CubicO group peptidase (beta-lactamase class C family)
MSAITSPNLADSSAQMMQADVPGHRPRRRVIVEALRSHQVSVSWRLIVRDPSGNRRLPGRRNSAILSAMNLVAIESDGRTWCRAAINLGLGLCLVVAEVISAGASTVDDVVAAEMKEHHILGVSVAIIENGEIKQAKGYGFTDQTRKTPVTTTTLFQAGSVSKPVAALGALRLVEDGRLSLDEDVNQFLKDWKLPESDFTKDEQVTLRRILSHSAGLTVHGFPGYAVGAPLPTLVQVLDGAKPANTAAIRVDVIPGSTSRYSGGGYTLMQQMIIDVTGRPFPEFMQEAVLTPLRMAASTYEQPLPKDRAAAAATGYYANGKQVKGKWHIYPEMAAAGLWTTASDLARFAIGIQQALAGKSNPVISPSMTREMLTAQKGNSGLGFGLGGSGETLSFAHGGRDEGFDTFLMAYAESGQGVVIMVNANDNSGAVQRMKDAVSREFHWPDPP